MKNKILLLALTFSTFATASFAQRSRNQDNGYNAQGNSYNDPSYDNNDYGYNNDNYTDDHTDYRARGRYNNSRSNNYPISARDFRQAMMSVSNVSFDQDKLRMARLIISRNNLTAKQIGTMASLFSFDNAKLAFAKLAYASCVDPQHYYMVSRVFSFSATKAQLYDYLARV